MRLPQTPSHYDYKQGPVPGPGLFLPTPEPDVRLAPGDNHEEIQPPYHHHHLLNHQPPTQQMRLPVTVGICKLCKRVYRPEVSDIVVFMWRVLVLLISVPEHDMTLTQDETEQMAISLHLSFKK